MIPQSLDERTADTVDLLQASERNTMASINCCMPGIIQTYDSEKQTASVMATLRKRVRTPQGVINVDLPLMTDVPVLQLGGGSHYLTMPVQPGAECLILFADNCIDAWYQSGGVQNQVVPRCHSLSDGFAIVGFRSAGRAIQSANTAIPEITDLVIAGTRMSEWVASITNQMRNNLLVMREYARTVTGAKNLADGVVWHEGYYYDKTGKLILDEGWKSCDAILLDEGAYSVAYYCRSSKVVYVNGCNRNGIFVKNIAIVANIAPNTVQRFNINVSGCESIKIGTADENEIISILPNDGTILSRLEALEGGSA